MVAKREELRGKSKERKKMRLMFNFSNDILSVCLSQRQRKTSRSTTRVVAESELIKSLSPGKEQFCLTDIRRGVTSKDEASTGGKPENMFSSLEALNPIELVLVKRGEERKRAGRKMLTRHTQRYHSVCLKSDHRILCRVRPTGSGLGIKSKARHRGLRRMKIIL